MDDFAKYENLRNSGAPATEVYQAAKADGLDQIARIRLLRTVYNLSLAQAKEVVVQAEERISLAEHQEKIAQALLSVEKNGSAATPQKEPRKAQP